MHWLSEVIAGGLMGYAIGSTVGKNFFKYRDIGNQNIFKNGENTSSVKWLPIINHEYNGLIVCINF